MLEDETPRYKRLRSLSPSCVEDDDRAQGDYYKPQDGAVSAILSDSDGWHWGLIQLFLPESSDALLSC